MDIMLVQLSQSKDEGATTNFARHSHSRENSFPSGSGLLKCDLREATAWRIGSYTPISLEMC